MRTRSGPQPLPSACRILRPDPFYFGALHRRPLPDGSPFFQAWAEGLRQRGKSKMAVVGAAMRKLVHVAYGVLKTGRRFARSGYEGLDTQHSISPAAHPRYQPWRHADEGRATRGRARAIVRRCRDTSMPHVAPRLRPLLLQEVCSANSDRVLATTLLGVGYQRRLVSITFRPPTETLNSPSPPLTVSTSTSFSPESRAATRAAMALLIGHTGQ